MVTLNKIYTRGGDKGETSLANGARVPKHSLRVSTYGTVDEANAIMGIIRLYVDEDINEVLCIVQNDLFDLGADLATPMDSQRKGKALRISQKQVTYLEQTIDHYNQRLAPLTSFVLPGGGHASAYMHQARTVVRRAEREICALIKTEPVNNDALVYLNRLSDLLFVMARTCNNFGKNDILWKPGENL